MNVATTLAIIPVVLAACALLAAGLNFWYTYRNPDLQPHPIIKIPQAIGEGFRWVRLEDGKNLFPQVRTPDGGIWTGETLGVSLEKGKPAYINIAVYGANQGVGHYTWWARTWMFNREVGAGGHFNIDRRKGEDASRREYQILGFAIDEASRGVSAYYRPLEFSVNEKGELYDIYDPETGRAVYVNHSDDRGATDDLFRFGPPPEQLRGVPYSHPPGISTGEMLPALDAGKSLTFRAWDVYGQLFKYGSALIDIQSDTGYRYQQTIMADANKEGGVTISVPALLEEVEVAVTRGGYHALKTTIPLKEGNQVIEAFLEPAFSE